MSAARGIAWALLAGGALAGGALACGGRSKNDAVAVAVNVTPVTVDAGIPNVPSSGRSVENDGDDPIQIIAGWRFCARVEGRVYCTELEDPDEPVIQEKNAIAGIEDAVQLGMGQSFGCVATRRGTVQCWGDNTYGQLGAKLRTERADTPVEVLGLARVRRIYTGRWHACAVLEDGSVLCWGRNDQGQTGSETNYFPNARELVAPAEVAQVKADLLALGLGFTCARTTSREVSCWGRAQMQDASMSRNERPTLVPGLAGIEQLSTGESCVCGVLEGKVVCWGEGRRLIPHSGVPRATGAPVQAIEGITNAVKVASGDDHGCALLADGHVACFGYPYSGALGRAVDEQAYESLPGALVDGVSRAIAVTVSSGLSCALTRDGEVLCWGRWYTSKGNRTEPKPVRVRLR